MASFLKPECPGGWRGAERGGTLCTPRVFLTRCNSLNLSAFSVLPPGVPHILSQQTATFKVLFILTPTVQLPNHLDSLSSCLPSSWRVSFPLLADHPLLVLFSPLGLQRVLHARVQEGSRSMLPLALGSGVRGGGPGSLTGAQWLCLEQMPSSEPCSPAPCAPQGSQDLVTQPPPCRSLSSRSWLLFYFIFFNMSYLWLVTVPSSCPFSL